MCAMCGQPHSTAQATSSSSSSSTTATATNRNYQQEAIENYNKLSTQLQELITSHPDPSSDPMFGELYKMLSGKLAVFKEQSEIEDKDRNIPIGNTSMPRNVLRAITGYRGMKQIYDALGKQMVSMPKRKKGAPGLALRLVRYADETTTPIVTGFGITFMGENDMIQLCRMKWYPGMGKWDPRSWAFLIASCLMKCGMDEREIRSLHFTHKLQDNPNLLQPELFPMAVALEFRDIIKSNRFQGKLDGAMYATFGSDQDMGMLLNDFALHFDRRVYKVAIELNIPNIEDRSSTPAMSYVIGDTNKDGTPHLLPQDCFGRFHASQRSYVKARLGDSVAAQKYFPFIMDILEAQTVSENVGREGIRSGDKQQKLRAAVDRIDDRSKKISQEDFELMTSQVTEVSQMAQNSMDFVVKQLPKLVKKLCKKYGYSVPEIYRVSTEGENSMFVSSVHQQEGISDVNRTMEKGSGGIKCCLQCGALRGNEKCQKVQEKKKEGEKAPLLKCPCTKVYFCSVECQKVAWKDHKKTCTAPKKKKKKKKKK